MSTRTTAEIESWLLDRLRERIGPAAEQVNPHLPFSYYGLDSLDAVALAAELEEWLGVPVEPDVAWDHPTAHAVAAYLSGEEAAEARSVAAPNDANVAALLAQLEADDATA